MKIAIITPGFLPVPAVEGGAVEVLITNLIEENEIKKLFEFDIYTVPSDKLKNYNYEKTNIIQVKVNKFIKFFCKFRNAFFKLFKLRKRYEAFNEVLIKKYLKKGYDYILIENTMKIYEDIYLKTEYKDNLLYHMHNDIDGTTKPEYLCEFISKTAKGIFVVSNYIKNRFNNVCFSNRVKVLYNCVDTNKFNSKNVKNVDSLREKYNIKNDDVVFMFSGRINKEKGIKEFIKAFTLIKNKEKVKIIIVGSSWFTIKNEDEYFNELKELSRGLEDKIIFTGYIYPENMSSIYALADVVVIPSMWEEPFGVVALEAMAMQLPLIVTNSGGLPEVVDENCAIIIDKKDGVENKLAKAMENLLEDEQLRNRMGQNAYDRIKSIKEFDKVNYYDNFCNLINEISNNKAFPK